LRLRLSAWICACLIAATIARAEVNGDPAVPDIAWVRSQSALCETAIEVAERHYQLPPGLLASIARAESGRPVTAMTDLRPWPWTINADGNGLFLDSKAAAVAWVRLLQSHHRYVDVGCLQVDLPLHPQAFASLEAAFDPTANADYAARYLSSLYRNEAGRDWNVAVGLYHSHTTGLAAEYRDRVALVGGRILHGVLDPVPLYVRAIRQGTLHVPLGTGRSTPINLNRQPAARPHHRPTPCEVARILGPYLNGGGHCRSPG